jgi:hypothetical protein
VRRRERYSMQITCPRCGKIGRVVWAESRVQATRQVSFGFHTGPGADRAGNPMVYCDACNIPLGF